MKIKLRKWTREDAKRLAEICDAIDLKYLTNRIPHPYHEEDANAFLDYVFSKEGKENICRAIVVDGKIVGNISVEGKSDVFEKDGEIGYFISADYYNQGITTQAVKEICKLAFEKLAVMK